MTTDWRALCAELVDKLTQSAEVHWNYACNKTARQCDAVVERARAALADEPASVTGQPSDEAWDALVERAWDKYQTVGYQGERFMYDRDFDNALEFVRQGLACWGNPAPQLEGKVPLPSNADQAALMVILGEQWLSANAPERLLRNTQPADGEAAELVTWLQSIAETIKPNHLAEHQRYKRAADLLQRLSPPQPVPVSERLPGPEDCTAEGRCWLCYTNVCNVTQWSLVLRSAILDGLYSHWLPAHALPLPGQEVEQ